MYARDACADILLHRAADVDGVAEALVGVGDQGNVHGVRHAAGVFHHLRECEQTGVRHAENRGAGVHAGHVCDLEADGLRDLCVQRAAAAGQNKELVVFDHSFQNGCFFHYDLLCRAEFPCPAAAGRLAGGYGIILSRLLK